QRRENFRNHRRGDTPERQLRTELYRLTTVPPAPDANISSFEFASRPFTYLPRIASSAVSKRACCSCVPTVIRRKFSIRGLLKWRTITPCSRNASANTEPPC